mmetsp:Transcript_7769/g.20294  ORF Transcript_7769/g.20294 Transcript_7769/m.20294 type:complete len:236 (-) Transcript_7769:431-1138(-)
MQRMDGGVTVDATETVSRCAVASIVDHQSCPASHSHTLAQLLHEANGSGANLRAVQDLHGIARLVDLVLLGWHGLHRAAFACVARRCLFCTTLLLASTQAGSEEDARRRGVCRDNKIEYASIRLQITTIGWRAVLALLDGGRRCLFIHLRALLQLSELHHALPPPSWRAHKLMHRKSIEELVRQAELRDAWICLDVLDRLVPPHVQRICVADCRGYCLLLHSAEVMRHLDQIDGE